MHIGLNPSVLVGLPINLSKLLYLLAGNQRDPKAQARACSSPVKLSAFFFGQLSSSCWIINDFQNSTNFQKEDDIAGEGGRSFDLEKKEALLGS